MLIGINGGYFPAICRVCFVICISLVSAILGWIQHICQFCINTYYLWTIHSDILSLKVNGGFFEQSGGYVSVQRVQFNQFFTSCVVQLFEFNNSLVCISVYNATILIRFMLGLLFHLTSIIFGCFPTYLSSD